MVATFFEYFMDFMAMMVIVGAAYYWYRVSKIDLPLPAEGETANLGGMMSAMAEMTDFTKRAAGYSALGGVLLVSSWAMGSFATVGG